MERALNVDLIRSALGQTRNLPTAEELTELLAQAEMSLFLGRAEMPEKVLATGWLLFSVAQAPESVERYTPTRRYDAWKASAHIFDLALSRPELSKTETLRLAFAAQLGYLRGGLHPNAIAIYRRTLAFQDVDESDITRCSLAIATRFLGMDRPRLYSLLDKCDSAARARSTFFDDEDLEFSPFRALGQLVAGVRALMRFLLKGERQALEQARERLRSACDGEKPNRRLDLMWVAANLLDLCDGLEANSVWSLLPPAVPDSVKRAFTYARPPILALWEPQVELLKPGDGAAPLDPSTRRLLLSVPTSGGKTLIGQLIAMSHLATDSKGVCFVVPTRALARELAAALRERFQLTRFSVGIEDDVHIGALEHRAVVMTPERLGTLLRNDPANLLERFSLFIVDEAHSLGEGLRGFTLESVISALNVLTQASDHRIMLMSAAIGNRGQIATWLDPQGAAVVRHSPWRGPRRLHGIFTTSIDWASRKRVPTVGRKWTQRDTYSVFGRILLRLSATSESKDLTTTNPVGVFNVRVGAGGAQERKRGHLAKDRSSSTAFYRILADLVAGLGNAGPVLVVRATRKNTREFATALAEKLEEREELKHLRQLLEERLSSAHPLVKVIGRGIAYHHAGLAPDILAEIESAVREGLIRYIVATTSLTDGVNLPVRTVVVEDSEGKEWSNQLSSSQIVNAFGRAGRACLESEGWAILARQQSPKQSDFDRISPGDEALRVRSILEDQNCLENLASYEEKVRLNTDALFDSAIPEFEQFVSYIWWGLSICEELGREELGADAMLQSTFGFAQATPEQKVLWSCLAESIRQKYFSTDKAIRRRWAQAGGSLATAKTLDELCELAIQGLNELDAASEDIQGQLQFLGSRGVLEGCVKLPTSGVKKIYDRQGGKRSEISIDVVKLLKTWMEGKDLAAMADEFLSEVADLEFRHEQMGDHVSQLLEHHLPWALSIIVATVNRAWTEHATLGQMIALLSSDRLNQDLPRFVRAGVSLPGALLLLDFGIRSRKLAQHIAQEAEDADIESGRLELQEWLRTIGLEGWLTRFAPSRGELQDILEFVRDHQKETLASIVEGQVGVVEYLAYVPHQGSVSLRHDPAVSKVLVVDNDDGATVIGEVKPEAYGDLSALLGAGFQLDAHSDVWGRLVLSLRDI